LSGAEPAGLRLELEKRELGPLAVEDADGDEVGESAVADALPAGAAGLGGRRPVVR
jgi:hypothetical protein